MKSLLNAAAVVAVLAAAAPAFAAPVELVTHVMVETHKAAADGTTKVTLVPAARVVPGNHVVYQIAYRNSGPAPAANLVIANPVPAGLVYTGAGQGSPEPELSVDGTRFGTLSQLSVRTPTGTRAATPADIRVVRWRLSKPVAPGASGQVSFRATLK
jgi:uncharacterized repeat protein (TIGR01451 family)